MQAEKTFTTDYDVLEYARSVDKALKRESIFNYLYTRIVGVGDNFRINGKLEITVPRLAVFHRVGVPPELYAPVIEGGVVHENAHAILFPLVQALHAEALLVYDYAKSRGVPFNWKLYDEVSSILSDVYNELIIIKAFRRYAASIAAVRVHFEDVKVSPGMPGLQNLRVKLEAGDPLSALLLTHTLALQKGYKGGGWLSEWVYRALAEGAFNFKVDIHESYITSAKGPATLFRDLMDEDVYRRADNVAAALRDLLSSGHANGCEGRRVYEAFGGTDDYRVVYAVALLAYYRLLLGGGGCRGPGGGRGVAARPQGARRPRDVERGEPSKELLEALREALEGDTLSRGALVYAARLLATPILVVGYSEAGGSEVVKVRWYRRPRGRLDPRSLARPSPLEWSVYARRPGGARRPGPALSFPGMVSIVLDVSGSTFDYSPLLAPLLGVETTVYDVERVVALSTLYPMLVAGADTRVSLTAFSTSTWRMEAGVREAFEAITELEYRTTVVGGGTDLTGALREALAHHRDGRRNYLLVITDAKIYEEDAAEAASLLSTLHASPVLFIVVNPAPLPRPLAALNGGNTRVARVWRLEDYDRIRRAVEWLARKTLL